MGNIQNPNHPLFEFSLAHKFGQPDSRLESKYDPLFGFPRGRRLREVPLNYAEIESAQVPYENRNHCAHLWVKWNACERDYFPRVNRCKEFWDDHDDCMYLDYVNKMKERERERRLDVRNRRILAKMAKEQAETVIEGQ